MDADRAIAALAERQHGLVTRPQALERGLTESAVGRRLAAGRWKRVHSGVYRLAGVERTWEQELHAHLLAAGPGAVASHRSAATLLSLPGVERKFEITVARCHTYTGAGLEVHRASLVEGVDRALVRQIPATSPARTLIDLASVVDRDRLESILDHTLAGEVVDLDRVRRRLAALGTRGRKGAGSLLALLDERSGTSRPARSPFERLLWKALCDHGLPVPEREFPVRLPEGRMAYLDLAYPQALLAIEADSYLHHSTLTDWSRDRLRNNELLTLGWRVLPVTFVDLRRSPATVA
ncbi:MAG TPA: type IV toxin-antitoxin system AbiEi family antitoxin domain-containing protein, partial [Actinomycetota bacterium]|nr:type IV toxin-antitoxin system AbiEi family antitoxin domain-containing protein [Actinomycetota bacterium]